MGTASSTNGGEEECIQVLVGKPEVKRPPGRPRRRWVDNIMTHDRDQWRALVNIVMNLKVPLNPGKFLNSCTIGSFSRRDQLHEVSYLVMSLPLPPEKHTSL
jgi:hypothetical protein